MIRPGKESGQGWSHIIGQPRIDLGQGFLQFGIESERMNNALTRRLAVFLLDDEGRDVVTQPAAAAGPRLIVAGNAGPGIEDGTKAVAAIGQWILRRPFVDEERLSCPCHRRVHRLGLRVAPGGDANPYRHEGNQADDDRPEAKGRNHDAASIES